MWPNHRKISHYPFQCLTRYHGNHSLGMYTSTLFFRCWSCSKVQVSRCCSSTQLKYVSVEWLPYSILCHCRNHHGFGQCNNRVAGFIKIGKLKPLNVGAPNFSPSHHRVRIQFLHRCINEHVHQLLEHRIQELYWCSKTCRGKQFFFGFNKGAVLGIIELDPIFSCWGYHHLDHYLALYFGHYGIIFWPDFHRRKRKEIGFIKQPSKDYSNQPCSVSFNDRNKMISKKWNFFDLIR